jgi:alkylation response protein AidB-like acyl-CoA dehydrogenase
MPVAALLAGNREGQRRDRKKVSAVAIDFTLSDSQQELQKNARAFAESVLRPVAGRIDRAADGWESFRAGREAYREMAHAGFTKSFIPAAYGGAGFSMLDFAIAAEELTRVDVNVPTTLLATGHQNDRETKVTDGQWQHTQLTHDELLRRSPPTAKRSSKQ